MKTGENGARHAALDRLEDAQDSRVLLARSHHQIYLKKPVWETTAVSNEQELVEWQVP